MDKAVVTVEESPRQSDSGTSVSKCSGSLVQINAIAIDITGAVEEMDDSPVHEHFCMRGYVAGMRKKDARTCFPFTSEGDYKSGLCNLPPLCVPTFRWWRCSSCVPDISSDLRKESLAMDVSKSPVPEIGLVEHTDGKDNDHITNISACCIRGKKATSKKGNEVFKDAMAGNHHPDMQEPYLLSIREIPSNADASHVAACIVHPPCTVGPIDNVSSGSDASGRLPCKRKPKLRFLAEIMVKEKKPMNIDDSDSRSASPSGVQVTSTGTEHLAIPQLEFDGIDKASRSPRRKRKNVAEDGRIMRTIGKRSKGIVLDADRTCKRVDISDQESEENASTKADFPDDVRSQLIKPRNSKYFGVGKKSRQAQTEDGTVLPRDLRKTVASCTNTFEENIASSKTNMTKIRHGPKLVEEMEKHSSYYLDGNQTDKVPMTPNTERSTGEADREDLTLSSKIIAEDCSAKRLVALDLSLNSFMDVESNSNCQSPTETRRFIPDLNEEFPFQSAVSRCNEEYVDAERHVGVSNHQNNENGTQVGSASDDIPMDIVELLAKNQRERELENATKHLMPDGTISSTRSYPPALHYNDGNRYTMNFPFAADRRSPINMSEGLLGIPVSFSQLRNCSRDKAKLRESQFKVFDSLSPNEQRKKHFSGLSNPIVTDHRISTRTELYWPPRGENDPFPVCVNQNRTFLQTNNTGLPLFSDRYGKGKITNDVKEIDRGKSLHNGFLNKKGRIGSSSKSSVDPYSNDRIPALQLMSLMDQGISSGSSFKVGTENFIEKPFSPCNHHPRVNGKGNQNFIAASQSSQNNQFKDFPKLRDSFFFSGESSKKASSHSQGQAQFHLEGSNNFIVMETATTIPRLGVCTLNKNPAEFSVPDARNKYTITARDLKPRKRINLLKQKLHTVTEDGRKGKKVKKDFSTRKSKPAQKLSIG